MPRKEPTVTVPLSAITGKRTPRRTHLFCPVRNDYKNLGSYWKRLSGTQQAGYARLGTRMAGLGAGQNNGPMTGFQCYMSVNMARMTQQLPVMDDAPLAPEAVPFINNFTVSATSAQANRPSRTEFHLILHADPIAVPVQVSIAVPSASRDTLPREQDFKEVGVADGIAAGGTDITALYYQKYPPLGFDYKIPVRLVPLSPSGFRGKPVMAMAEVVPLPTD